MADETPDLLPATTLTIRDVEILISAVRSLKNDPLEVDYSKLAREIGAKTSASATTSWHKVKGKLFGQMAPKAPGSEASASAKAKTPRKSKDLSGAKIPNPKQSDLSSNSSIHATGSPRDRKLDATKSDGMRSSTADLHLRNKPKIVAEDDTEQLVKDEKDDVEMTTESPPSLDDDIPHTPVVNSSTLNATIPEKLNKNVEVHTTPNIADEDQEMDTPKTPTAAKPGKRGRKSKAEKEAEAAANARAGDADVDEEKPVKKARKTPTKKPKDTPATPSKSKAKGKGKKTNANQDPVSTKSDAASDGEEDSDTLELAQKAKRAAEIAEANDVLTGKKVIEASTGEIISGVKDEDKDAAPKQDEGDTIEVIP